MGGLKGSPSFFEQALHDTLGRAVAVQQVNTVSGGCINQAARLITPEGSYFIKWNHHPGLPDMFACEAQGLQELARHAHFERLSATSLVIPQVLGYGQAQGVHYLLLQYMSSGPPTADYWELLGRGLAAQHRVSADRYGHEYNNYIGRLRQQNDPEADWPTFFIHQRLRVQARLALQQGLVDAAFMQRMDRLYEQLPALLPTEPPALLHGDLWSGNVMVSAAGTPCLIDPAVYYGHREVELAFTRLFGGFGRAFYDSYAEAFPLLPGHAERVDLYNLYPLLVHVNLFGASYLAGVERTLRRYL